MIRLWCVISLFFALPAYAQVVTVQSGEHADFSRLVLVLPDEQAWRLGRTADGYELAIEGEKNRFDVSAVFDRIPKDRLTGLYADPVTGNLHLTIGCACYALPFSLNDRTIVIDLRNGTAPEGSSFEVGLDGTVLPPILSEPQLPVRPQSRRSTPPGPMVYDWLSAKLADLPPSTPFPLEAPSDLTESLRKTLVEQLAEGAARNVVDLAMPNTSEARPDIPALGADLPIRINTEVGLRIGIEGAELLPLQPNGAACFSDDALDLPTWGQADPDMPAYTGLSNAMVGEFDRPQEDAIFATAKRYVFLGFGAETRALFRAFDVDGPESDMLKAMSFVVDGDHPSDPNAFSGMGNCDTAAALWAFLSDPPRPGSALNRAGLLRAFSALPAHLRINLGPRLVDGLLERGDADVAEQIRETMNRGLLNDTRSVALVTADLALAQGENELAVQQAEEVLADPGTFEVEALIALVEAQVAAGQVVAPSVVESIAALIDEHQGDQHYDALIGAYGLALAGAGQFTEARAFSEQGHPLDPLFWKVLAEQGSDDDLLLQALQPDSRNAEPLVAQIIAARLTDLGFPKEAAAWHAFAMMAESGEQPSPSDMVEADVDAVSDETSAARWSENWPTVAENEQGVWGQLSAALQPMPTMERSLSLSSATEALAKSQETRALIDGLLAETKVNSEQP